MKKKTKKTAAVRGSDRLFRIIIIILAVILVIMIGALGAKIKFSYSTYTSTPNDILHAIQNGRYIDAWDEMRYNIPAGETAASNSEYEVPYALMDYYEAESMWYGYEKAAAKAEAEGSAEAGELKARADGYREAMEEARSRAGDLEFMTDDIDKMFSD